MRSPGGQAVVGVRLRALMAMPIRQTPRIIAVLRREKRSMVISSEQGLETGAR
jgi:hypothetical protein